MAAASAPSAITHFAPLVTPASSSRVASRTPVHSEQESRPFNSAGVILQRLRRPYRSAVTGAFDEADMRFHRIAHQCVHRKSQRPFHHSMNEQFMLRGINVRDAVMVALKVQSGRGNRSFQQLQGCSRSRLCLRVPAQSCRPAAPFPAIWKACRSRKMTGRASSSIPARSRQCYRLPGQYLRWRHRPRRKAARLATRRAGQAGPCGQQFLPSISRHLFFQYFSLLPLSPLRKRTAGNDLRKWRDRKPVRNGTSVQKHLQYLSKRIMGGSGEVKLWLVRHPKPLSRMAERVGFEPTVEFPQHTLSKRAP